MSDAMTVLEQNLSALSEKDQATAKSLLSAVWPSDKQMAYIESLARKAVAPKPAPVSVAVGDFAGVIALFDAAKAKGMMWPKIKLALPDGRPVVLSVAGASAKQPGTVNVTDGGPFGDNVWYGRVQVSGAWEPSRKVDAATMTSLTALLSGLASDPAGTAAAYGKMTGSCCFCSRLLTDSRSVDVGYGPICAAKWSLPWGA